MIVTGRAAIATAGKEDAHNARLTPGAIRRSPPDKERAIIPTNEHRIATKIHLGLLPRDEPHCTWAGAGDGRACDGCDRGITAQELQLEVEFDLGATLYRFHVACFLMWYRAADTVRPTIGRATGTP